jgi:hypothetical protein
LVSSPSTPGAYLFKNSEDRFNYEENLDEEKQMKAERSTGNSLDLMNRLSAYLCK